MQDAHSPSLTWFDNRLLRGVTYLDGQGNRNRVTPQGWQPVAGQGKVWCLVMSRACYQETRQRYPIKSISELRRVVHQHYREGLHFHTIGPLKSGQREVVTFSPHPRYQAACQQARFVVPASLLLSAGAPEGLTQCEFPDHTLFLLKLTQGEWLSTVRSDLVNDAQKALLVMGGHPDTPHTVWAKDALLQSVARGLIRFPLRHWNACRVQSERQQGAFPWKPTLLGALLIYLLFLGGSSAWLSWQVEQKQQRLQTLAPQLDQVMQLRHQLEESQQRIRQLRQGERNPWQTQLIWSLIAELNLEETDINYLQAEESKGVVSGTVPNATRLLEHLLSRRWIADAAFSAPVRRRRPEDPERFTIALTFAERPDFQTNQSGQSEDPEASPVTTSGVTDPPASENEEGGS
jgi:hypothetical protein